MARGGVVDRCPRPEVTKVPANSAQHGATELLVGHNTPDPVLLDPDMNFVLSSVVSCSRLSFL
jgi:hypothetical protein